MRKMLLLITVLAVIFSAFGPVQAQNYEVWNIHQQIIAYGELADSLDLNNFEGACYLKLELNLQSSQNFALVNDDGDRWIYIGLGSAEDRYNNIYYLRKHFDSVTKDLEDRIDRPRFHELRFRSRRPGNLYQAGSIKRTASGYTTFYHPTISFWLGNEEGNEIIIELGQDSSKKFYFDFNLH